MRRDLSWTVSDVSCSSLGERIDFVYGNTLVLRLGYECLAVSISITWLCALVHLIVIWLRSAKVRAIQNLHV